ncbi:MAG: hypothetical protein Q8O99_07215 [bacterium]|nr:hypothetical protein [bacterium]
MLECEVKLLNIDREHVIDRLTKLGAVFVHDELVVDIYLRRDILRKQKAHARVRCTKARTVLTVKYKLPAKAAKLAYEVDTLLPDALVEDYGTQARWEVIDHVRVKKRTTYTR